MTQVVIVCRGGVIQCIVANNENIRFKVVDHDEPDETISSWFQPDSVLTDTGITEFIAKEKASIEEDR